MKKMVAKKAPKKYAMGGSMTTTGTNTTKAPENIVSKVVRKVGNTKVKDLPTKTAGVIKRGANRVTKNDLEGAANVATMGLYARGKRLLGGKYKGERNGGKVTKAKNGKSFPDLNKDGKITKADVLKGRGVIAKSGTSMKKCKYGCN